MIKLSVVLTSVFYVSGAYPTSLDFLFNSFVLETIRLRQEVLIIQRIQLIVDPTEITELGSQQVTRLTLNWIERCCPHLQGDTPPTQELGSWRRKTLRCMEKRTVLEANRSPFLAMWPEINLLTSLLPDFFPTLNLMWYITIGKKQNKAEKNPTSI